MRDLQLRACLPAANGTWQESIIRTDLEKDKLLRINPDTSFAGKGVHGWLELRLEEKFRLRVPLLRGAEGGSDGAVLTLDTDELGFKFEVHVRSLLESADLTLPVSVANQASRRLKGAVRWQSGEWICERWQCGEGKKDRELFRVGEKKTFPLEQLPEARANLEMPPAPKSPRTILLTSLLKHSPQAMDGSGTASWSSFANPTDSSTLRTLLLTMERSLKTGATSEVANFLAPDGKTLLWAPLTEGTRQILGSHLVDHELEAAWRAAGGSHGEAIDGGPSLSRGPLANSRHEIVVLAVNRTRTGSDRRLFGDLWNAMAESYLEALRTAKNGQELSLVPVFKSGKPVAAVVFSVRDASPLLRPHPANDLVRGDVLAPNPLQRIVVEATARVVPSPKDGELQATLELSRWLNHEGQATTFSALLSPIYSPNRSTRLAFDLAQIKVPEASLVRVGALDLEPGELPPLPDGGDTTNREQRRVGLLIADYRPPLQTTVAQDKVVEVLVQLQLPLRRAQPGGQDDGPAAVPASLLEAAPPFIEPRRRGERPLVILRPGESGATEPLVLEGRESSDRSRREMTLQLRRLRRHSVEAQPERAMIIDRTPFLVAEVELNALGTDEKALDLPELGNWSLGGENGSGWELLSQDFTLRLPPQGLGEQLERRSGEGIEVGERSELRFSPPAALVLGAAPFEQRFAEAQWNLRRLLERPGQRLPGAPIRKLTFELLYGLSTTVEASGLMLSELFSRFGVPAEQVEGLLLAWPATQAQKDAFKGFGHAWTKRLQELASRLAVLEPWSVREPDAPLRLTEGVRGQLRAEADLRYPILGAEPPPGSSIPNHPDGLAGGVAWGFESANVYEATWRDPRSVSAVVERPMFSALGGWGFQKTVFDEGRQAIYSDVAMGRTFYYALERIGRVGVLWNRAKHVIVYERTVAPSLQFTGKQSWHLGRPIVRKVREFVELLEPRRAFASEGGDPLATGALLGSFFPAIRIPVDSAWGGDVGELGWQVPLWRPGEDPRAYPKPGICLTFATSPDSGTPKLEIEVDEPEKLVFFTDTRPGTGANSDLWEAIPGVDFVDLPVPRPADETVADGKLGGRSGPVVGNSRQETSQPATPEQEPGYGRFTLRLVDAERGVDIVGARSPQSIEARLRNVTFQRCDPLPPKPSSAGAGVEAVVTAVRENLLHRLDQLQKDAMAAALRGDGRTVRALIDGAKQALVQDGEDLRKRLWDEVCDKLKAAAQKETTQAFDRAKLYIETRLVAPIESLASELQREFGTLHQQTADLETEAQKIRDALGEDCSGDAPTLLKSLESKAESHLAAYDQAIQKAIAVVQAGLRQELTLVRSRLLGPLGVLRGFLDQAVGTLRGQVRTLVNTSRAELLWARDHTDAGLVTTQRRLEEVETKLRSWSSSVVDLSPKVANQLTAVADGLHQWRQSGSLDDLAETVTTAIDELEDLLDLLATSGGAWIDRLQTAQKAIEELEQQIEVLFQRLAAGLDAGSTVLQDAALALPRRALDQLLTELHALLPWLEEDSDACRDAHLIVATIVSEVGLLGEAIGGVQDVIKNQTAGVREDLLGPLRTIQGDWLKGGLLEQLLKQVCSVLEGVVDQLHNALVDELERLATFIAQVADEVGEHLEALVDRLDKVGAALGHFANDLLERAAALLRQVGPGRFQLGSPNLRFLRAWGSPPRVPGLDFSLSNLGYYFHGFDGLALPKVDLSAVTALLDRAGNALRGLGVRLPTLSLGDRLLPDKLEGFDLSKILPDFAGIRLDGLFPGVSLPKVANDRVKVTHGIDSETRRAWVQAEFDVPYEKPINVLPFDPLNVRMVSARMRAVTRAEGGLDGKLSSRTRAELLSTWELSFSGTVVVRLRETQLLHENGRTSFHVDPSKVELNEALRFLTDLLEKSGLASTGLTIRLLPTVPPGLECQLLLPLPDVTLGAFSIYNLVLLVSLTLGFDEEQRFFLETRFGLGRRDRPFALAVSILAGGGAIELGARYVPATGALNAFTRMQIALGAALAFSFGPVRGGVWLFFGVAVEWQSRSGGGLTIELFVLLRGEAQVFGFISVSLSLALRARYQGSNGSLVANGELEITVKVGRFFETTVHTQVSYQLAGGAGKSEGQRGLAAKTAVAVDEPPLRRTIKEAADRYVDMLGG